jgi:TatD DNase family protein
MHPNDEAEIEPDAQMLVDLATSHSACIAIGETGLDYYRVVDSEARESQKYRFREHIRAALTTSKPLIIHTREAAEDTLSVMQEENAGQAGGVMHCFAEDWNIAQRAMEMNFYISLSGIVTFKNAKALQDLAKQIPLDRLLIETDAPYLAPVPFRGRQNHPALVKYVAQAISELRGIRYEDVATQTTENFQRCFRIRLNDRE